MTSRQRLRPLAVAALALVASALPPSPGCALAGCDVAASFISPVAIPMTPPGSAFVRVYDAPTLPNNNASSPGCVSNGAHVVCAVAAAANASSNAVLGYVGVNATSTLWVSTASGTSRCASSARPRVPPLPVMGASGDIISYDAAAVTYINGDDGSVGWSRGVYPTLSSCPNDFPALGLTNQSDVVFVLPGLGEVAAYIADGVPQSFIDLRVNDSGTTVYPLPSSRHSTAVTDTAAGGLLIPVSQTLVDGARALHVARFWNNTAGDPNAPLLSPTPSLYLSAVDQRNAAVDRLWLSWQAALPLDGTGLAGCVPPATAGGTAVANVSADSLRVAGPLSVFLGAAGPPPPDATSNGAVVFALSCDGGGGSGNGTTTLFAVAVNDPLPTGVTSSPALLWQAPLPTLAGGAAQLVADPVTAAVGPSPLVWAVPGDDSGVLVRFRAADGTVTDTVDAAAALAAADPALCALGSGAARQPFVLSGAVMASLSRNSSSNAASALLLPLTLAAEGSSWLVALAIDEGGGGGATARVAWCIRAPGDLPVQGQVVLTAASSSEPEDAAATGTTLYAATAAGVHSLQFPAR